MLQMNQGQSMSSMMEGVCVTLLRRSAAVIPRDVMRRRSERRVEIA